MRWALLQTGIAIGAGLALLAGCTGLRVPEGTSREFVMNCRAMEPAHDWKPSDPPAKSERMLFTPPAKAPPGVWFSGRDEGIALCTACAAGSNVVQSFEWYAHGFKEGELKIKACGGKSGRR